MYKEFTTSGSTASYGNYIVIKIDKDSSIKITYAHLQQNILVKKGDKVTAGKHIAYMGITGNSSGPHLHYGVKKNGTKQHLTKIGGSVIIWVLLLRFNIYFKLIFVLRNRQLRLAAFRYATLLNHLFF